MDQLRDAPQIMSFTENGLTVSMSRQGDHGFIYLSVDKGKLPPKYSGAYTTFDIAREAVKHLFEDTKVEPKVKKAA